MEKQILIEKIKNKINLLTDSIMRDTNDDIEKIEKRKYYLDLRAELEWIVKNLMEVKENGEC